MVGDIVGYACTNSELKLHMYNFNIEVLLKFIILKQWGKKVAAGIPGQPVFRLI